MRFCKGFSLLGCKIDKNLSTTQAIMGFINQVDTANNPILEEKVEKAKMFAGIGSAGPGIVAGTMLILYRVAMALFVGFAPIFILCLLFKKTAPLFQKWLFFGLATIFSSVLLAVMADISADLIEIIAKSLFVSKTLLEFTTGQEVSGISQAATQQLGVGIMLSTLLVTVPPMAGLWFNGIMGTANPYSPLTDRWNVTNPTTAGTGNKHSTIENQSGGSRRYEAPLSTHYVKHTASEEVGSANNANSTSPITQQPIVRKISETSPNSNKESKT